MSQGSLQPEIHRRRLFLGCFISLISTAFGFVIRAQILEDWRTQFQLSESEIGNLLGAGLFPFAITIILFSLIVDRIGYGKTMVFAFVCHAGSAVITFCAPMMMTVDGNGVITGGKEAGYAMLYIGTFVLALGNGTVEAVINPVVATIYEKNKTHWLNILHAGWPGGLVLGGVLALYSENFLGFLPGPDAGYAAWQWKVALVLLPTIAYGLLLMGQKFPVQERVAAGISYMQMLKQFGALSCFIVSFLLVLGFDQIAGVISAGGRFTHIPGLKGLVETLQGRGVPVFWAHWIVMAGVAAIPTLIFLVAVRALGKAMFVFLLLVMVLLATTELGVDSWISDIMSSVLENQEAGAWVLIYTSAIMFVLRFFAGPIVHRTSPLGLLAVCAGLAAAGLVWLSMVGTDLTMVFAAATLYGIGKTFFWPTTLGVVAEQYPEGGTLLLNAIAGVGMISVGVLGNPAIGILLDHRYDERLAAANEELHAEYMVQDTGMIGEYLKFNGEKYGNLKREINTLDQKKKQGEQLTADEETNLGEMKETKAVLDKERNIAKQNSLLWISVLPVIMLLCYLLLIFYFRSKGGYKPKEIATEA